MLKVVTLTLLSLTLTFGAEKIIEIRDLTREDVRDIVSRVDLGIDDVRDGTLRAVAFDDQIERLRSMGYDVEIVLDYEDLRAQLKVWEERLDYHTYATCIAEMESLAQAHPDICLLDTLGQSVQGRQIVGLKVSDNPTLEEFEPEVRFVGTYHGDEKIATEVVILFAGFLLDNYGTNPTVTELVNGRETWLVPIHNPDGHAATTRSNANGVDLNRDHGYQWNGAGGSSASNSQPETEAMHLFSQEHNFTLSCTYHSGAVYVNYIFNYTPNDPPDSAMILSYSNVYGSYSGYAVTNGYEWYQTNGDLNDYSYGINSNIDWTIELSYTKIPSPSLIDDIYAENEDAMLYLMGKAGQGIGGFVLDSLSGDTLKNARIYIEEHVWPVYTDPHTGDFVRNLLPGTYTVRVEANGYEDKTVSNVRVFTDSLTVVQIELAPGEGTGAYKLTIANTADDYTYNNRTYPFDALGPADGNYASIGVGGEIVLDMSEDDVLEGLFEVVEASDAAGEEGYQVYVSNGWEGPWSSLGSGTGTDTFDVTSSGLSEARFVRIVDDGDGSASAPTAGYDLDAVQPVVIPGVQLEVLAYYADDALGDGDGIVEPGETVDLDVTLKNRGSDYARGTHGILSESDPYVTIVVDSADVSDIPSGGTGTTVTPYRIDVLPGCPEPYAVTLSLTWFSLGGFTDTESFSLLVGPGGFESDVEDSSGFTHGLCQGGYVGDWYWCTSRYHSPDHAWKTGSCTGNYQNNSDICLDTPEFPLLPGSELTFFHWMEAETSGYYAGQCYDAGIVLISVDGGDWQVIQPDGGYSHLIRSGSGHPFPGLYGFSGSFDWTQAAFDLSGYSGMAKLRFRFGSDQGVNQEGWYVDDITVTSESPPDIDLDPWSLEVSLSAGDSCDRVITVSNQGEGTLSFTAYAVEDSSEARSWLSVVPASGSIPGGGDDDLTATLNASDLDSGTFYGTVHIDSDDPDEPWLAVPVTLTVSPGICGDANGDGSVTSGDGFTILNYFGSGPAPVSCWAANVNGDSGLTTGDGFHLLNYLGAGPALDCAPCTLSRIKGAARSIEYDSGRPRMNERKNENSDGLR
jgi:hypothetical protein